MRPSAISADVLFEEFRSSLRWEWVAGLGASERRFDEMAVRSARSGADLVGYLNYIHPYRLQAMRSVEGGPQALVEEGHVRWLVPDAPPARAMVPAVMSSDLLALDELPWVEVVFSGALARASGVDALVAAGVRGIVVAGTGNATVHEGMEAALQRARDKGVWIWRGTRCAEGLPVASGLGANPAEADLAHLPVAKARIAMMLALAVQPRD